MSLWSISPSLEQPKMLREKVISTTQNVASTLDNLVQTLYFFPFQVEHILLSSGNWVVLVSILDNN